MRQGRSGGLSLLVIDLVARSLSLAARNVYIICLRGTTRRQP